MEILYIWIYVAFNDRKMRETSAKQWEKERPWIILIHCPGLFYDVVNISDHMTSNCKMICKSWIANDFTGSGVAYPRYYNGNQMDRLMKTTVNFSQSSSVRAEVWSRVVSFHLMIM
jgi:hypothetical protein